LTWSYIQVVCCTETESPSHDIFVESSTAACATRHPRTPVSPLRAQPCFAVPLPGRFASPSR
jgi:hypothetical protein